MFLKITRILNRFLRIIIDFHFSKNISFFTIYSDGKSTSWSRKQIKDVRNLFRLETLKKRNNWYHNTRHLFRLEKKNEEIKDRILRDIRNVFKLEKENKVKYYQLKNILIKLDYI